MAKIKHNNYIDTINDLLLEAQKRGVIRLDYDNQFLDGSKIIVNKKNMINFGTCGYLALENHPKIIEKSIDYTKRFGTQFSISRTYLESRKCQYLEELLSTIYFNKKVLTFSSTTLLHTAVIPCVVDRLDAVILDQQCHASIQTAVQIVASKGVTVEIIRHSNVEMLEHFLKKNRDKYQKIWYMIDGVYSMFGDLAPLEELNQLMLKYPQLHLYMDDAHGMSWSGKHGSGRMFENTLQNERTIYVSTMAKGFGVMGGVVVFPNEFWYKQVRIYGGALTHSHPIPPPILGACIASAKIHLSDEIISLQDQLSNKLNYAHELFSKTDLPIISNKETPIFFLGTGQPKVGYHLNKRVLDDGYYVNIGLFPAVPIKNTGLRFTITNHNSLEEIQNLVHSLKFNFYEVLKEEDKTLADIQKAFHLVQPNGIEEDVNKVNKEVFSIQIEKSISKIDNLLWNKLFENENLMDSSFLNLLEQSFSNNAKEAENWDFYYLLVKDKNDTVIVASFFTFGLMKDDMLSEQNISTEIENVRLNKEHYLCSNSLLMGSLVTEGNHLFIKKEHAEWENALQFFIKSTIKLKDELNANTLLLRDFDEEETINSIFHDVGFVKVNMPNTNKIISLANTKEEFLDSLSKRSKRHLKEDVLSKINEFKIEVVDQLRDEELTLAYQLFLKVCLKNRSINIFPYPFKFFEQINLDDSWEFIKLYVQDKLVCVGFCQINQNVYNPLAIGIDYQYNYEFNSYRQMLFQVVLRAIELDCAEINFGFTADIEKKKLGAKQINKFAYLQIDDFFNQEIIESIKQNADLKLE